MVNVTAELPGESGDVIIIAPTTEPLQGFSLCRRQDGALAGSRLELARLLATAVSNPVHYRFVYLTRGSVLRRLEQVATRRG